MSWLSRNYFVQLEAQGKANYSGQCVKDFTDEYVQKQDDVGPLQEKIIGPLLSKDPVAQQGAIECVVGVLFSHRPHSTSFKLFTLTTLAKEKMFTRLVELSASPDLHTARLASCILRLVQQLLDGNFNQDYQLAPFRVLEAPIKTKALKEIRRQIYCSDLVRNFTVNLRCMVYGERTQVLIDLLGVMADIMNTESLRYLVLKSKATNDFLLDVINIKVTDSNIRYQCNTVTAPDELAAGRAESINEIQLVAISIIMRVAISNTERQTELGQRGFVEALGRIIESNELTAEPYSRAQSITAVCSTLGNLIARVGENRTRLLSVVKRTDITLCLMRFAPYLLTAEQYIFFLVLNTLCGPDMPSAAPEEMMAKVEFFVHFLNVGAERHLANFLSLELDDPDFQDLMPAPVCFHMALQLLMMLCYTLKELGSNTEKGGESLKNLLDKVGPDLLRLRKHESELLDNSKPYLKMLIGFWSSSEKYEKAMHNLAKATTKTRKNNAGCVKGQGGERAGKRKQQVGLDCEIGLPSLPSVGNRADMLAQQLEELEKTERDLGQVLAALQIKANAKAAAEAAGSAAAVPADGSAGVSSAGLAKCAAPACQNMDPGGTFKCCSRCRVTRYCGATCQKVHWKEHKSSCQQAK